MSREADRRRVLFVSQSAHTGGGVERWLDRVARHLAGSGWETVVGLVEGPVYSRPERYLAQHPHERLVRIPCMTGTPEGRRRALLKAIEASQPDIIVPLNVADVLPAVAELKRHGSGVRLLAALHGHDTGQFLDLRHFRGVIDRAVSVSVLGERLLKRYCTVPENRVGIAPAGAEPQRCATDPARAGRPLRLAYVGRLVDREKNVRGLAALLGRLDEIGLDFVCDVAGAGEDASAFGELVGELVSRGRVRMLGEVPNERLYDSVYPRAAILLLTSPAESGPMVAWEAMLHSVVPAAFEFRGLAAERALIDGETALVVPFGETGELAQKIMAAVASPEWLAHLGEAARSLARQRYAWEVALARWSNEFEACVAAPCAYETVREAPRGSAGRLDRLLGRRLGETVRGLLGRACVPADPGDEWPHTFHGSVQDEALDLMMVSLDR